MRAKFTKVWRKIKIFPSVPPNLDLRSYGSEYEELFIERYFAFNILLLYQLWTWKFKKKNLNSRTHTQWYIRFCNKCILLLCSSISVIIITVLGNIIYTRFNILHYDSFISNNLYCQCSNFSFKMVM